MLPAADGGIGPPQRLEGGGLVTGRRKTLRGFKRTPQEACSQGDGDRSTSRIVSAAIVGVGLTFSASLYPLPGQWPLLELWQAEQGQSPGLPGLMESSSAKPIIDLANVELPTLVHLAQILEDEFPPFRTDVLLKSVERSGVTNVVRSLEVLAASGVLTRDYAAPLGAFGGAGGGGGPSAGLPPIPPELAQLLEMLKQLPLYLIEGLSDVIATLFPALIGSAPIQHVTQVLSVVASTAAPGALELPAPPPTVATPTAAPPPPAVPVSAQPEPAAPLAQAVRGPAPDVPPLPLIIESPVSVAPTSVPEIGNIVTEATESLPILPDLSGLSSDFVLGASDDDQNDGSGGSTPEGAGTGTPGPEDGGTTAGGDESSAGETPSGTAAREFDSDPSPDPSDGRSGDLSEGAATS